PDSMVYQYTYDLDGSRRFLYISSGVERINGVTVADVLRDPGCLHRQVDPEQSVPFVIGKVEVSTKPF
ncbi:MAG TPA: hypothetical protein VHP11_16660, partial [Tepidisphaeraceae bacterium]|nr:hypothetical protein [Tepidisphaeraceae bacterium]